MTAGRLTVAGPAATSPSARPVAQPVTARLLDTALGVGAGVEAELDEDADAAGAPVPDAKVVGPTDAEQSEISGATAASCTCAELVELADGEADAVADGEAEAVADDEADAVAESDADGAQVAIADAEPASPADGDADEPLPGTGLISQMKVADPAAPVVSAAVTVTS